MFKSGEQRDEKPTTFKLKSGEEFCFKPTNHYKIDIGEVVRS